MIAHPNLLVHELRSAAAAALAQDGDTVAMALARIVAEGVLPAHAVRDGDIDVTAGRERRQRRSLGMHDLEAEDILGLERDGAHEELHGARDALLRRT